VVVGRVMEIRLPEVVTGACAIFEQCDNLLIRSQVLISLREPLLRDTLSTPPRSRTQHPASLAH